MCERLRAELILSFKFSTLDLTIVGAHYDVPNDSQQVICQGLTFLGMGPGPLELGKIASF